jgi:hypothetical protein
VPRNFQTVSSPTVTLVRNDPVNTACSTQLSRSQAVAKMIKLRCKVPNIEAAELASANWRCRTRR